MWRWYGHIIRLHVEHPTSTILDFNPQLAGYRRPTQLDVVVQELRTCNMTLAQTQVHAHVRPK